MTPNMLKRLALFAAAIMLSLAAAAQSWQGDLDLANIQVAAADRHLQAALDAKNSTIALAELQQAIDKYTLAKNLFDQVTRHIAEVSGQHQWPPNRFTGYGESQRGSRRSGDGVSESTAAMIERIRQRGGAQSNR
jgi:hypothetical protein